MTSVLIVDDEYDIAKAMQSILEDEGYKVRLCGHGREALKCLREAAGDTPDLILVDVMMPYVSGLELLKQLRQEDRFEAVPVVLMNGSEPQVKKSDYGWTAFLRKPFDVKLLLATVEGALGKPKQER